MTVMECPHCKELIYPNTVVKKAVKNALAGVKPKIDFLDGIIEDVKQMFKGRGPILDCRPDKDYDLWERVNSLVNKIAGYIRKKLEASK